MFYKSLLTRKKSFQLDFVNTMGSQFSELPRKTKMNLKINYLEKLRNSNYSVRLKGFNSGFFEGSKNWNSTVLITKLCLVLYALGKIKKSVG